MKRSAKYFATRHLLLLLSLPLSVSCEEPSSRTDNSDERPIADMGGLQVAGEATNERITPEDQETLPEMIDQGFSPTDQNLDSMMLSDMNDQTGQRAKCEVALGGDPWEDDVVEAQEGFEAELMGISLEQLPELIDISGMPGLFKGLIAYMLERPSEDLGEQLTKEELLTRGALGRVVAASLTLGLNNPLGIDILFLRRGLHRYYHCERDFPLTLEDFKTSIFDFAQAESIEHESIAKCGPRRISSDPELGVYVAETLVDGIVRETEIILEGRREDGNLDFIIYNEAGLLSDRTRFPTLGAGSEVMAASPYVCTSCHLNSNQETGLVRYDLLFPETGPCR